MMRTTLDIDEDILNAAREIAAERKVSAGKVLSDLARKALVGEATGEQRYRNGFALLPRGTHIVTEEHVRTLLEENPD
ncbi:MAG: CopG family transcriptional regulator [Alphaproteobacteria bacterium]|nr:CopG family transcriptional regulator [Alphaproteobacteria bacterium]